MFQRVFTWRWSAPGSQAAFHLDFAELERVWDAERERHRAELDADRDLEGDALQLDVPYPMPDTPDHRGGKVDRTPPQLSLLMGVFPENATRLEMKTGHELDDPEKLARRLEWVFKHRGRPEGLSPDDYGAQRELTVARSLSWAFFEQCKDTPAVPVCWREKFANAAIVLGYLLWARNLGRAGVTMSAKNWAAVLPGRIIGKPCSIATVWRHLQFLERAGYLIRLRRWKPGLGGRPVALAKNWYGLGPRALADLEGSTVGRPEVTVARAVARVKRRHLRAEGRRLGVDLLAGYAFPALHEFTEQILDTWTAAQAHDEARVAAWRAGEVPTDWSPIAQRPSWVFELASDELEVFDALAAGDPESSDRSQEAASSANATGDVHVEGDHLILEPLGPELERSPDDVGIAEVRRLLRGANKEEHRKIVPGVTARARTSQGGHRGSVARHHRPIPSPGRETFAERCATSRAGAVGCVSRRDSREQPPAIPIASSDVPPQGCEKSIRTGPQARDAAARRARDCERQKPAGASGPQNGPLTAEVTVINGCQIQDRNLARLLLDLANVRGFVVT